MPRCHARILLVLTLLLCLSGGAVADGIAVIRSHDIDPYNQALAGFSAACNDRVKVHNLGGDPGRQREVAEAVRAQAPRLVLAVGLMAAQVAMTRLQEFPSIYVMVAQPRKYGLVGNNIAGISLDIPVAIQFQTYKNMLPGLRSIGTIYDPGKSSELVAEAKKIAAEMNLELVAVPVHSQREVPGALRGLIGRIGALWMIPDDTVVTTDSFKYFLVSTLENSVPFIAASDIFVEVGALAAVTPDYSDVGRQSCKLAQALEKGELQLSDLNVVPPEKVNLTLNLKTARKIGIRIPESVIDSARTVIQ